MSSERATDEAQALADEIREHKEHNLLLATVAKAGLGSVRLRGNVDIDRPSLLDGKPQVKLLFTVEVYKKNVDEEWGILIAYEGEELYAACSEFLWQKDRL